MANHLVHQPNLITTHRRRSRRSHHAITHITTSLTTDHDKVREKVGEFFRGLANRTDEVKRRCRTILQTKADVFTSAVEAILQSPSHVVPTVAWV
jgi:hypothetical protein